MLYGQKQEPKHKNYDPLAFMIAIKRHDLTTQFRKLQSLFFYTWQYNNFISLQTAHYSMQADR